MTCHCGAPALTRAGKLEFCKAHKEEAVQAMKKLGSKKTGDGKVFELPSRRCA